jgi:hypothetical protein
MLRAALLGAALVALPALALDSPQWPPPGDEEARMQELRQVIIARDSTPAQRDAARKELVGLLKSPAGRARGPLPAERRPARAAIDLIPSSVVNVAPLAPPPGGVAHVEVVVPPKPVIVPNTGIAVAPTTSTFAIDPRTGHILHEAGTGYVDPRTGQFIPR